MVNRGEERYDRGIQVDGLEVMSATGNLARVAGVRKRGKEERRAREAGEDRARGDRVHFDIPPSLSRHIPPCPSTACQAGRRESENLKWGFLS